MNNATRMIGVMPPPPGQKATFENPPSQMTGNIVLHSVCLSLVTLSVSLRLYTRKYINRELSLDDCKLFIAPPMRLTLTNSAQICACLPLYVSCQPKLPFTLSRFKTYVCLLVRCLQSYSRVSCFMVRTLDHICSLRPMILTYISSICERTRKTHVGCDSRSVFRSYEGQLHSIHFCMYSSLRLSRRWPLANSFIWSLPLTSNYLVFYSTAVCSIQDELHRDGQLQVSVSFLWYILQCFLQTSSNVLLWESHGFQQCPEDASRQRSFLIFLEC